MRCLAQGGCGWPSWGSRRYGRKIYGKCSGSISYARGRDNSAVHRLTITDNWQAFRRTCTDNRRTLDDNSAITTGSARMLRSYAHSCHICHFRDARLAQFPSLLAASSGGARRGLELDRRRRRREGSAAGGPWGDGRGTGGWARRGGHDRRSRGQPFSFLVRLCHETGGVLLTQGEVDGRRGAQEALTAGRPETSRAW